jgi:hypothetical protein
MSGSDLSAIRTYESKRKAASQKKKMGSVFPDASPYDACSSPKLRTAVGLVSCIY